MWRGGNFIAYRTAKYEPAVCSFIHKINFISVLDSRVLVVTSLHLRASICGHNSLRNFFFNNNILYSARPEQRKYFFNISTFHRRSESTIWKCQVEE